MGKFQKGQSGNVNGRPKGSGHADKLRQAIEGDVPAIIKSMVIAATGGDTAAAKLLLDRAIPTIKPIAEVAIVDGLKGRTLSEQGTRIIEAMGAGLLTPEQANVMLAGLANLSKIREVDDIDKRLSALEEKAETT